MKECYYRWWTTFTNIPKPICGNNNELDVYDTICSEEVLGKCPFKTSRPEGQGGDGNTSHCKECGYETEKDYEGYCFQCACEKGIEHNPFE